MSETPDYKPHVTGVFDRAAPSYDGNDFFSYYGRKLVEWLDIPAGARVLDVAAGRGAILFPAAERVGENGQVVGVDLSTEMVKLTNGEIQRRGLTNAEMLLMDAEHLDFPDESFDFIVCGFALFFFDPHMQATMSAFYRLLKPGGMLGTITTGAYDQRWLWLSQMQRDYLPPDFEVPTYWRAVSVTDTPEKLDEIFQMGNFTEIQVRDEPFDIVHADPESWWTGQFSTGWRMVLDAMTPESQLRFKSAALEGLPQVTDADGKIRQHYHALLAIGKK